MSYQDSYGSSQGGFAMPRVTPVVKLLLIANLAVFVFQLVLGLVGPELVTGFLRIFGLTPDWWQSLRFPLYQLVTYGFLHADGHHVFFNLLTLFFFGTMLEGIVGGRRFAVFYGTALVLGGLAHLVASLTWSDPVPAIGASGATMAVMIAVAVMRPKTLVIVLFLPVQLWILASFLAFYDVYRLASDLRYGASDGVAYMVHLGGAAFGLLAVKRGWIWKDPIEEHARRQDVRAAERAIQEDQRMDELLAKIHREGMNALSSQEKDFLKRMAKR